MRKSLAVALLLVLVLAGLAVFALRPKGEEGKEEVPYTFTRDWLKKGNLWVFDQPQPEYLEEMGATGTAFSVYYSGFNEYDWNYVKTLHRHGFKVTANFPTGQSTTTENLQLREEAAKRDIHGNPIQFLGLEELYNMCGNHPLWREFLMNRIEEQARGGVDGILIDEPGDTADCFCDYCMRAFNDYLAEHYSPDELQRLFGITDLSTFNYREYLLAHGGTQWWDDPNPQLQVVYLQARYWNRTKFIGELIQHARQAAGWDIPVTANTYGLEPNHQIFVPLLDFVIFEMPITAEVNGASRHYLRPLPGKNLTTYLLAEALDPEKPFSAFPDVFELKQLSEDEWWLWRHWLAEARACGASFMIPYQAYVYGGGSYTIEADKISPYTRFFAEHPQYYENLERVATVALLHDLHSTLTNRSTWQANWSWESFENLGMILQEAHVPFEVLYQGDGVFVPKSLTLEKMRRYRAIIVPRYYDLDSELQALLSQYTSLGGKVVRCDDLPRDELLLPTLKGLVADLGLETNAPANLGVVVYRRGDSLLLHLLNYSYDRGTRDFRDLTNLQFTLTIPEGVQLEGKTLRLVSPDAAETTLEYAVENGKVTFTVPSLHCYSVASFE
jgi:hypothetical protein